MKILIIGHGVVGQATGRLFKGHDIDIFEINSNIENYKCKYDMIFICVPTPLNKETGRLNTSIVENAIVCFRGYSKYITVRSTVPIGFCEKYNVDYFPEFLQEHSPKKPQRLIYGGMGYLPLVNVHYCTRTEAEMIKLASNAYLSMRLAYFYEIKNKCEDLELDFAEVRLGVCSDPRIGFKYADEPYLINGKCLPKDLQEFSNFTNSNLFKEINNIKNNQLEIKDDYIKH